MTNQTSLGPSLPPNVSGDPLGTLTIRFQECSILNAHARIQFWGEHTFSDIHPCGGDSTCSSAVEYPLVGSIVGLQKYMEDASPLQVKFLRSHQLPHGSSNAQLGQDVIGCASIPNMSCITDLLKPQPLGRPPTANHSFSRNVHIHNHHADTNGCSVSIREAKFELLFQATSHPTATHLQTLHDYRQHQSLPANQPSWQVGQLQQLKNSVHVTQSSRPKTLPYSNFNGNQSIGGSMGLQGDLSSNSNEEQQNILEELLDLCADDMTMPTLETANSCVDPVDMWISRIVASASSPAAKEFSSLVAAGSRNSGLLRKVGLLQLEIDDVILLSTVANSIKGRNDFHLHYILPPGHSFKNNALNKENRANRMEVLVCEKFGNQSRKTNARVTPKDAHADTSRIRGKNENVSLLCKAHSTQDSVNFTDDDSVREWLEGTIEFSLSYCASKSANHPKLPRVAMLANKSNETKPRVNSGKLCLGRASLKLRDVILSRSLSLKTTVDFILAKDAPPLQGSAGKGAQVGSVSVKLSLLPGDQTLDDSTEYSFTSSVAAILGTNGNPQQTDTRGRRPSSTMTPHPISALLSNFAGKRNVGAAPSLSNTKCQATPQQIMHPPAASDTCGDGRQINIRVNPGNEEEKLSSLKPVQAPPIWLDIRVHCITDLSIDGADNVGDDLKLSMSCSEPMLSSGNLRKMQRDGNKEHSLVYQLRSQHAIDSSSTVSSGSERSWQIALDAGSLEEKSTSVTLRISQGSGSGSYKGSKNLVGLVKIPCAVKDVNVSQQKICDWLPAVVCSGWFDVSDPSSNSSIGKVFVSIAAGMLRQIRGMSTVYKGVFKMQRWWRRTRSRFMLKETQKPPASPSSRDGIAHSMSKPDNSGKDISPSDEDPGLDTVHAGFISSHIEDADKRRKEVGSPDNDSLFEEWSQQSLPTLHNGHHDQHIAIGPTDAVVESCSSIASSRVSESDDNLSELAKYDDDKGPIADNKLKYFELDKSPQSTAEQSSCNDCDINQESSSCSDPNSCDHLDIHVHLGTISCLREILSAWCCRRGRSEEEVLLPVSGLFVSYSTTNDDAVLSNEEDLQNLCLGNKTWHSKLSSIEAVPREIDLNIDSKISVQNHETNTELILLQTLEIKLWFVPVITKTLASMINDGRLKNIKSFSGCTVISAARCPLYHLYTLKANYAGNVPFTCRQRRENDTCGYIMTRINRADLQGSPAGSTQKGHTETNGAMSTLKPMNLETSFSHGQDDCGRQCGSAIDPPEDIRQPHRKVQSKRKIDQSSDNRVDLNIMPRESKRPRTTDNTEPLRHLNVNEAAQLNTINQPSDGVQENDTGEESETLCPSETSFGCDQDSDADEDVAFRSLSSVMESLANINTKMKQASSFAGNQRNTSDCFKTSSTDFHCSPLVDASRGNQLEPPDENTPTGPKQMLKSPKTSEKGSSPMSLAYRCTDAATSPHNEEDQNEENKTSDGRRSKDDGGGPDIEETNPVEERQDVNIEDNQPHPPGDRCMNNEATPMRRPSFGHIPASEKLKHRLEQSLRRSGHTHESGARSGQGYLTAGTSRRFSTLISPHRPGQISLSRTRQEHGPAKQKAERNVVNRLERILRSQD